MNYSLLYTRYIPTNKSIYCSYPFPNHPLSSILVEYVSQLPGKVGQVLGLQLGLQDGLPAIISLEHDLHKL